MSEGLPSGWALASCADLFTLVTSGSRGWAKYYAPEGCHFIRIGDLSRGTLAVDWMAAQRVAPPDSAEGRRTRVEPGDLLVSITADLGVIGVVPDHAPEAYVNQHIALARTARGLVPRFVGWYLDAESGGQRQFREFRRGATKAGLGLDDIRSVVVPLAPLAEQGRIVAEIEKQFTRLDEALATLKAVQAKLKRARASVLKAAVEGRLVPTEAELARAEGRSYEPASVLLERILTERRARWPKGKKYQPPAEPRTDDPPELPEGWTWATLDQVTTAIKYGTSAKCSAQDVGVPVLRMGNIVDGRLDFGDLKYLPPEHYEFPDQLLTNGELLFNRTNSPELVGKCAVFDGCPRPCACASYIIRVAFLPGLVPHYIAHSINSARGRAWVRTVASQQVGQANVNGSKLAAHALPLPPANEQIRIVAEVERRLSVIDNLEHTVEQTLARCGRLRQSILKRAFEGRLVPQDPSDEPASQLLERIRAQRTNEARA